MILPSEARSLLVAFSSVFTQPTFHRFLVLLGSAILTTGRRTVANILRTAAPMARGHRTTYQRVFSSAEWSALRLACQLSRLVLVLIPADVAVPLVGDDTVDGHPGRKVYGKARHRDPVRSSHGYTAWRYGHKWVVLAVLVRFPWANRPWALPVLVDLYRSKEDDQQRGRPHRTPARIMATLLRVMIRWFPRRRFVFVGDSGYCTHELARSAHRHRARLALVSKLHPEANLFEPPPPYPSKGRPPVKGQRRPKPSVAVAAAELRAQTVAWYGGGTRQVGLTTGTGHWYKAGEGLVPLAWVFVRDRTGTHRDEYFSSTDPEMTAVAMIAAYCGRWNLELFYRHFKQAFGRRKLRSQRADNAEVEATWSLLGLWALSLHGQAELSCEAVPASRVSAAGLLRAYRGAMREHRVAPGPGESLWERLGSATIDGYSRRSKASRDYPRKKRTEPIGAPQIRPATTREIEQAGRTKDAHQARLTA